MRRRLSILVPAAVGGLVAPVTALAGTADAATGPQVTNVEFHNVRPSQLSLAGGFPVQVEAKVPAGGVCSFDVQFFDGAQGQWVDLGRHQGHGTRLRYLDRIGAAEVGVYRAYRVRAYDCNGNPGNRVASAQFTPYVRDNTEADFTFKHAFESGSKYAYHGTYARTTGGVGTSATYRTGYTRNVGIYGEMGHYGGRAAVYVDGVKKGTVSFYSARLQYRKMLFKYGWNHPGAHTVTFTVTGRGSEGGTGMAFDAVNELSAE